MLGSLKTSFVSRDFGQNKQREVIGMLPDVTTCYRHGGGQRRAVECRALSDRTKGIVVRAVTD
jgi:hypothetical protein